MFRVVHPTVSRLVVAALFLSLTACAGSGGVALLEDTAEGQDAGEEAAVTPTEVVDPVETIAPADAPVLDLEEETRFTGCEGGGCFLDPCDSNADCQSSLCVFHLGEKVCSKTCIEDCPDGWNCEQVSMFGSDMVFVCVSQFSHLCLPCADVEDCQPVSGTDVLCVSYQTEGFFCGASCDAAKPCPGGFECKSAFTTEGTSSKQCVYAAGVCPCTETAVDLGLATPCAVDSEYGTCLGVKACTAEGLSECSADVPASETCDGVDNDCDGETDEESCDDDNECTQDGCDPAGGCLFQPLTGDGCDDGDDCTLTDKCDNGVCAGNPVTCNDGNECTDDLCDPQGGCNFPTNTLPCNDGDPCTFGDHCADGACAGGLALNCDDGNPCTEDACAEGEGCAHTATVGSCDDGNVCTAGDHCEEGACVWSSLVACDDGNSCTTDTCAPGGGCTYQPNSSACDDSDLCTLGDKCANGQCSPGQMMDCDDSNPCTADSCNPLLGCVHANNSAPCDDFDPCTGEDFCAAGLCVGTGAPDCDDNNPCTTDYCNPMVGCTTAPNTNPCNDGNACTLNDTCSGGICGAGNGVTCDDGNPCTDDFCDPATGCKYTPNSGPCDDNNSCTEGDQCEEGACIGQSAIPCNDDNPCTVDTCAPGEGCKHTVAPGPCSDGDACTVNDSCADGACVPGAQQDCNDGNPCTGDSCSEGTCVHDPLDLPCDDGNPCTEGDLCVEGLCKGPAPTECDDGNLCTTDYCDPSSGCVFTINSTPCNDGNTCTTDDACTGGACTGGPALVCNDGNVCTDDSCLPDSGCIFATNTIPCDDGNACTTGDVCGGGQCAGPQSVSCDDSKICTLDSCDPQAGCVHLPLDAICDDSSACTVGDKCADGACVPGLPLDCNDANVCTDDQCNPAVGCEHGAAGGGCDDGNACTEDDVCAGGQCGPGDPVSCADGNVCTEDICYPDTGCANEPQDGACTDENACTVNDACLNGQCASGGPLQCDDGDKCTQNSCAPDSGCVYPPISPCCGNGVVEAGEECDDGNEVNNDNCSNDCKNKQCEWSDIEQLYCNGTCTWAGGQGCDQADADIFCKLKTCNCNSHASSFQVVTALNKKGFSCPSYGQNLGPMPQYCVNVNVWYQGSSIVANHGNGDVVVNVVCTD